MKVQMSELAYAVIDYVGPLDDPRIGWVGSSPSHRDLFKCERCGQEHEDCTLIPHKEDCSAVALINILKKLRDQ